MCFNNKHIINYIESFEEIDDCAYCNSTDTYVIDIECMGNFIRESLSKAYVNATSDDIPYYAQEHLSSSISEVLIDKECIFSDIIERDQHVCGAFLVDLFKYSGPSERDIMQGAVDQWENGNAYVVLKGDFYAPDNNRFSATWENFKETVKHGNRFFDIHYRSSREEMLSVFNDFYEKMEEFVPVGTNIIRARLEPKGPFDDKEKQTLECGPPPPTVAKSLRMSPNGISYFYGSEDEFTCKEEIKSSDAKVLIGIFKTKIPLKLINLSFVPSIRPFSIFSDCYDHDLNWAHDFLKLFSQEVSKPVIEDETSIEYIATQIVSEYIRLKGYQGIKYKSSLTDSNNYALFCGRKKDQIYSYHFIEDTVPDFKNWLELVDYKYIE